MKCPLIVLLFSLSAHAAVECTGEIFTSGKLNPPMKLEMKQDPSQKDHFSSEKDGYVFDVVLDTVHTFQINKLIVTEKTTGRRALSGSTGMVASDANSTLSASILEGKDVTTKGARLTCKAKTK